MVLDPIFNVRPTDPNFVDCIDTPLTEEEACYYLREGWFQLFGYYPQLNTLAIFWAQCRLEVGYSSKNSITSKCRNWNYGNIKKSPKYSPYYTSYDAGEWINGKYQLFHPYHVQTLFTAWLSPLEGAKGYLRFLSQKTNYTKAWEQALLGNASEYVRQLKAGGYFTADLEAYTKIVVKLVNQFKANSDRLLAWTPPDVVQDGVFTKVIGSTTSWIKKIFGKSNA